jgi:hypothetical protein
MSEGLRIVSLAQDFTAALIHRDVCVFCYMTQSNRPWCRQNHRTCHMLSISYDLGLLAHYSNNHSSRVSDVIHRQATEPKPIWLIIFRAPSN